MATKRGWHRVLSGWYRYTNAAGKVLAYVERDGSVWKITVLPAADDARNFTLSTTPRTYQEAKRLAEIAYRHTTKKVMAENATALARIQSA